MKDATFDVKGMTCNGCVASVTRVLKAVPGVSDVTVTLQPGSASVVYDEARTSVDAMKTAVKDAGYGVA